MYLHTLALHDALPICPGSSSTTSRICCSVPPLIVNSLPSSRLPRSAPPHRHAAAARRSSSPSPPRSPPRSFHPSPRSEEHTSELQSLMRISYAVFCLNKKTNHTTHNPKYITTY